MPKFSQSAQIRELNENIDVVALDGVEVVGLVVTKTHKKGKFLGLPKYRKRLAMEWLTDNIDGESSGSGHDTEEVTEHVNYPEVSVVGVNVEKGNEQDNEQFIDGLDADMYDDFGEEEHDTDQHVNDGAEELLDEENIIDHLDVNMEGFKFTVEPENEMIQ